MRPCNVLSKNNIPNLKTIALIPVGVTHPLIFFVIAKKNLTPSHPPPIILERIQKREYLIVTMSEFNYVIGKFRIFQRL